MNLGNFILSIIVQYAISSSVAGTNDILIEKQSDVRKPEADGATCAKHAPLFVCI